MNPTKNYLPLISLLPVVCHGVLDLGFVIDSSASIKDLDPSNWDTLLAFVQNVINRFTIGELDVHVGAVVYSNRVHVQLPIYIEVIIA